MKATILLTLALLFGMTACRTGGSNAKASADSSATVPVDSSSFQATGHFAEFLASVSNLTLPLTLTCGIPKELPTRHRMYADSAMQVYYPASCDLVVGRLWSERQYAAILYGAIGDWIYPEITTFDHSGNPIDSLRIDVYCEGEPGFTGSSVMHVLTDRTINVVDTLWTAALDSSHNEISGTDSTVVRTEVFRIDSLGRTSSHGQSQVRLFPK